MSYRASFLSRMMSMVAAIVITLGVQGLLLVGFDQMATSAQAEATLSHNAADPVPATLIHAQV